MPIAEIHAQFEMDFQGLCDSLEETIRAHQSLQSCLQAEKRLIIAGDVEGLDQCSQEKEASLVRIAELERQRIEILESVDDSDTTPTLKSLITLSPSPFREQLQSSQIRLEALMASIHEINQMNGMLVGRILTQISGLLGTLRHLTIELPPTYQQNGVVKAASSNGRTFGKR